MFVGDLEEGSGSRVCRAPFLIAHCTQVAVRNDIFPLTFTMADLDDKRTPHNYSGQDVAIAVTDLHKSVNNATEQMNSLDRDNKELRTTVTMLEQKNKQLTQECSKLLNLIEDLRLAAAEGCGDDIVYAFADATDQTIPQAPRMDHETLRDLIFWYVSNYSTT